MKLKVPNAIIDLVNLTKAKPILKVEMQKKEICYMVVKKNLKNSVSMQPVFMLILSFYIMIEETLLRKKLRRDINE